MTFPDFVTLPPVFARRRGGRLVSPTPTLAPAQGSMVRQSHASLCHPDPGLVSGEGSRHRERPGFLACGSE
ncbi:MAG: hypothetical protein OHK0044_31830 [Burkholderiaceae bacterium]